MQQLATAEGRPVQSKLESGAEAGIKFKGACPKLPQMTVGGGEKSITLTTTLTLTLIFYVATQSLSVPEAADATTSSGQEHQAHMPSLLSAPRLEAQGKSKKELQVDGGRGALIPILSEMSSGGIVNSGSSVVIELGEEDCLNDSTRIESVDVRQETAAHEREIDQLQRILRVRVRVRVRDRVR